MLYGLLVAALTAISTLVPPGSPPGPARAELVPRASSDSLRVYRAPVKEVRARRITARERLDRETGFSSLIEPSDWSGRSSDAASMLAEAVGMHVRETGGLGRGSHASLRGSTSAQLPVYLDGVLLNSPSSGEVDLASIDLSSLDRVEVYRGSAPLVLGGGSMGGAVHLVSAKGRAPWRAQMLHGSHGLDEAQGAGSMRWKDWDLALRSRAFRSEGDWEYLDDRNTIYNPDDDVRVRRRNNEARGLGVSLGARRNLRGWSLHATETFDLRRQGQPGLGWNPSERATSSALTQQLCVSMRAPVGSPRWLQSAQLHHRYESQAFDDPDGDLYGRVTDWHDALHVVGAHATGHFGGPGRDVWRAEVDWSRWRSRDDAQLVSQGNPQTRWSLALAWQPQWSFAGGRGRVSPGLRAQWHFDRFHGVPAFASLPSGPAQSSATFSPVAQLGARWSIGPRLDLKANLALTHRAPTLFELFGSRGSVVGRSDLEPERGLNRDLGLVFHAPEGGPRLELSAFWNHIDDLIAYEPVNVAVTRPTNLGRAELRGLEADLDFGRFGPWEFDLRALRMSALDRSDDAVARDKQLPNRPGLQLRTRTAVHTGPLRWSFDVTALGDSYVESGERQRLPSRVLLGAGLRWRRGGLSLDARLHNLGNEEVFDLWGHPLPGRTFRLALSKEISP